MTTQTEDRLQEGSSEPSSEHMSELLTLKENMDQWVKHINAEMGCVRTVSKVLKETMDNTEHNYELNQEMRQEIEELKQEIKLLKIIQLTMLKSKTPAQKTKAK